MKAKKYTFYQRKQRGKRRIKHPFLNLYIIIFILLISCLSDSILNEDISEVLLFIEGSGTFQLINAGYNSEPSKVLVDGSHRNDCGRSCSITAGGNHQITVQFNNIITSWDIMFQDIGSIKKIDLSNFISNSVTTMVSMFQRCSNLETVILEI